MQMQAQPVMIDKKHGTIIARAGIRIFSPGVWGYLIGSSEVELTVVAGR